ncbi:SLC2A4 regulator [Talpa occidentalis]|uniref:SLC2A4 regulator n=1 Tax=Talpa occidentalis TaxID=50954 RepID=UPI0023F916B9|nr:SLC2A4 regulator [Talpa occidentalis]
MWLQRTPVRETRAQTLFLWFLGTWGSEPESWVELGILPEASAWVREAVSTPAWACTWGGAREGPGVLASPTQALPIPQNPPGKALLEEVMAAAALTSLSTSPLLPGVPAAAFSPGPGVEPWMEALVRTAGGRGAWDWDPAREQPSPATPTPPLPTEAARFLLGEPALGKRKVEPEQGVGED